MKLQASEGDLQMHVCQLLDLFERTKRLAYFAVPNGMRSSRREVAKHKRQGLRPGVPDLVILFPAARVQFWELKRPGSTGGLKNDQLTWEKMLARLGFEHRLIRSINDAQDALNTAFAQART